MKYPNPTLNKYTLNGIRHNHGPNSKLEKVVAAIISCLIDTRQTFTAYNVTLIMRSIYPTRAVYHNGVQGSGSVRAEVHRQMGNYISSGVYKSVDISDDKGSPACVAFKRVKKGA